VAPLAWALVWVVMVARVYVGAHLPLDATGGLALGWLVGSALHLLLGAPGGRPAEKSVLQALAAAGLEVLQLRSASVDARASTPFVARLTNGEELFLKIVGREQRDADVLFKIWRYLIYREVEDETPFVTPKQQIEHAAYLSLLAERAGVRTPSVVLSTQLGDGATILAERMISATGLDLLPPERCDDDLLRNIWRQVELLRRARIAHRDLRRANVLVDGLAQPWLIDFGFSESAASDRRLAQDVAEMLASLAIMVGAGRAAATAVDVLGPEGVVAVLPLLQPMALSSATRHDLLARPGILTDVRKEVCQVTGCAVPALAPLARVRLQTLVWLLGAAFAIHLLLPQVGEVRQTLDALHSVRWQWLLVGATTASTAYFAAALGMLGAANRPLSLGRTALVELAGSFLNRMSPKGLGGMGLNERFLERSGLERPEAMVAVALSMTAGVLVDVPSLILALALLGIAGPLKGHTPKGWEVLVGFVVAMAVLGLLLWSPLGQQRLLAPLLRALRQLGRVLTHPERALALFLGAAGVTFANALTLAASLHAFGTSASLLQIVAVYLGGAAIASASPTPGGLGAIEAALVAGLTSVGIPSGPAGAGVLAFRLLTFWLPIGPDFLAFRYLRRRQII